MPPISAALLAAAALLADLDKESLLAVAETKLAERVDLSCSFETNSYWKKKYLDPGVKPGGDGLAVAVYGNLKLSTTLGYRINFSQVDYTRNTRQLIDVSFSDKVFTTYTKPDNASYGQAEVETSVGNSYFLDGSVFDIYPIYRLRGELNDPLTSVKDEGSETIGGVECHVIRIQLNRNFPPGQGREVRYWLTLDGPLVIHRYETSVDGHLETRYTIEGFLDHASSTPGRPSLRFPIEAKGEMFFRYDRGEKKIVYTEDPVITKQYKVMGGSVRVDSGVTKSDLTILLPEGTPVQDEVRKRVYVQGQDLRIPPRDKAEISRRMEDYFAKAEKRTEELAATSRARWEERSWLSALPWIATAISAALAVSLLIRSRNRN